MWQKKYWFFSLFLVWLISFSMFDSMVTNLGLTKTTIAMPQPNQNAAPIVYAKPTIPNQIITLSSVPAAEKETEIKELNFVFLHGMGGSPCALQLLSDEIHKLLPVYVSQYLYGKSDIDISTNTLLRCYPGYTDLKDWATNIADSIDEHFKERENIILVGHSMGGKAALYAVANNIGNMAERVALVVTINSPIKSLRGYYPPGGGPVAEYCQTVLLGSDEGVCDSVVRYDSSADGLNVSNSKHWLAFVSAETAPLSSKFDRTGVDTWPRNLDDGTVPLSAQFSDEADVIYYGEYGHSDISKLDEPSRFIANQTLRYIFSYNVQCSVLDRRGEFENEADLVLGTDYFKDMIGGISSSTGSIKHTNESFFKWQEWEDVVGYCPEKDKRGYALLQLSSLPILTDIQESYWLMPDDDYDCRVYLRSRAAPRTSVQIDWSIYRSGILSQDAERSFYDVEIIDGTPLTTIKNIFWLNDDPHDPRLWVWSEAQSPFRWFNAEWRVYRTETRQRAIIDQMN
ncbi:esterase/lipase family protein [Chloroflexota bacterium]